MPYTPALLINAVLGAMVVTIGLWFLQDGLSLVTTIAMIVVATIVVAKVSPTIAHVWMWCTLFVGLESIAWPFQMLVDLRELGQDPPLEDMQRVFTAVLFGFFSGIFWMTFAYGIYRRIQAKKENSTTTPTLTANQEKAKRRKKR